MIFTETKADSGCKARTGILKLPHGDVQTPAFMPVGTNATVKAIYHSKLQEMGYNLILGNTYHLYLRPGIEVIKEFGGLHQFSGWNGNILTDSGGFQVFSLATFRKVSKEGVKFRSHIDGSYHFLTPESVVQIQKNLGSDIQMALDVCTAADITYKKAMEAVLITSNWAERAKKEWENQDEFPNYKGHLFPIIQGNFFKDLRKISAEEILALDLPGIAIGGLSVGETAGIFEEFLGYTAEMLPRDKPHYLMGIGTPEYILTAVENGIDIFDCVLPTRIARNGAVFTDDGIVALKKEIYAKDKGPISEGCPCTACTVYSKGYVRHMIRTNEILASMLCTEHNLFFLYRFMDDIREAIRKDEFMQFKKNFLERYTRNKNKSPVLGDNS